MAIMIASFSMMLMLCWKTIDACIGVITTIHAICASTRMFLITKKFGTMQYADIQEVREIEVV